MKFLKIYRTVKNVFVKPKLKFFIGKWKNEHNLPVWRHGIQIRLAKYHQMYMPQSFIYVPTCVKDGIKHYDISTHKLPIKPYTYVWTKPIRKKLKKWHLSWIPPVIQLPIWTAFHIFDHDIFYKTKYGDYRYEYPAHITLVFFGLAISVTAYIDGKESTTEDDYWESLLTYYDCKDLKKTDEIMGSWRCSDGRKYKRFDSSFLKAPYKSQLRRIQNNSMFNDKI